MINDSAYSIYLKVDTSRGTCFVNIVNNVSSMATVDNCQVIDDGVEFDYWVVDKLTLKVDPASKKKVVRNFDHLKIYNLKEICYGHKKIVIKLNAPNGDIKALCLVSNSSSPAYIDQLTLVGNDVLKYRYIDLKSQKEKIVEHRVNFKILGIMELIYGDLYPPSTMTNQVKNSMIDLIKFLNNNQITYWANGRTLLSTLRSHGLDRKDNMLFLAIDHSDLSRCIEKIRESYRFFMNDSIGLIHVVRNVYGTIKVYDYESGVLCQIAEIFYYKKSETVPKFWKDMISANDIITKDSSSGSSDINADASKINNNNIIKDTEYYWCNAGDKSTVWSKKNDGILNFPVSYILPLRQEFFYNVMINIPAKSEEICRILFGDSFMTQDSKNNIRYVFEKGYESEPISDFSPFM